LIVIADTGPLNYLILVGEVEILQKLFGHVIIPAAVLKELRQDLTPQPVAKWMSALPSWLEVRTVSAPEAAIHMENLGTGEREAILLAEKIHADWLIIDDYAGRQEALRRHLPVMGTLRVLDEAAARGLVDLADVLFRLKRTTFFLSNDLVQWLLDRDLKRRKTQ